MRKAAETGYLNAMAAATYLSNKGVPFRKAHEHIGNAVRLGLETNRELQHLTLDELRAIQPQSSAKTSTPPSPSKPRWTVTTS